MNHRTGIECPVRRETTTPRTRHLRQQPRPKQNELFARSWGGARRGAGRKPKGERALVSHSARAQLAASHPVHVTTRLVPGLPSLRRTEELRVLLHAFRCAQERSGLRIVHYSVQTNHLHLLVEARGRESLSLGIQGLLVRIARALNRLWRRAGKLFADRFHAHVLKNPAEVRRALVYVLQNARKHGLPLTGVDACSSGAWFDGWSEAPGLGARLAEIRRRLARLLGGTEPRGGRDRFTAAPVDAHADEAPRAGPRAGPRADEGPLARARTWLLTCGWRRGGAIRVGELPTQRALRKREASRGTPRRT